MIVGSRVKIIRCMDNDEAVGKFGTVTEMRSDNTVLVSLANFKTGHGANNSNWWFTDDDLVMELPQ